MNNVNCFFSSESQQTLYKQQHLKEAAAMFSTMIKEGSVVVDEAVFPAVLMYIIFYIP